MNPVVDKYFNDLTKWKEELTELRKIVLDCGLEEELKWRQPCYTLQNKNIVIISGFKDYCALNFFKGSLIADPHDILIQPGENTQSGRQIRFTSLQEIIKMVPTLKVYINEAIKVEKTGKKVDFKKTSDYAIPEELLIIFNENTEFKNAFNALTPGRQKAYLLHFLSAKQPQTRINRIEKYMDRIIDGKGITDCVCGHSKKMPYCDGSHKYF